MVTLNDTTQYNMDRNASKGNQLKWFQDDIWYKADFFGYEALAEYVVSYLLEKTTVAKFVRYDVGNLQYKNRTYLGCKSKNFLKPTQELITLEKLFRMYKNEVLYRVISRMDVEDKIKYVVDSTIEITGLSQFGEYLTMILEMDALFLNEDRHFNNIAVLYNLDSNTFDYCPIFDNGAALLSDTTISFLMDMDVYQCIDEIEAKPFTFTFDEQIDAAEELYGIPFKYWFTLKDVEECLNKISDLYSDDVIKRVYKAMAERMRKFQYLRSKESLTDTRNSQLANNSNIFKIQYR